jgi:hypothetical protein
MTDQTDLEKKDTPTPDPKDQVTDSKSQQSSTSGGEDWEARYKGLQKTAAKKDSTIVELQEKLDKAIVDIEEVRTSSTTTAAQKAVAEKAKTDLEAQLNQVKSERDAMQKTLSQQAIIVNEFSHLGKLSKYIPKAEDDETFKQNATIFATDIEEAVQARVKTVMSGATPPQPKGKQEMATESEEEALYHRVTSLAGIAGKEAEFEEARKKYVTLMQNKS